MSLSRLEIDLILRSVRPRLTSEQSAMLSRALHINASVVDVDKRGPNEIQAEIARLLAEVARRHDVVGVGNTFLNESKTINYVDQKIIQHLLCKAHAEGWRKAMDTVDVRTDVPHV